MNKLLVTSIGFLLLSIGFACGILTNVGFASHTEKVTILTLADVKTDKALKFAEVASGPQHITMQVEQPGHEAAPAKYAAQLFARLGE
jgi:hypothetical protein